MRNTTQERYSVRESRNGSLPIVSAVGVIRVVVLEVVYADADHALIRIPTL
jgi:hypothetical protein